MCFHLRLRLCRHNVAKIDYVTMDGYCYYYKAIEHFQFLYTNFCSRSVYNFQNLTTEHDDGNNLTDCKEVHCTQPNHRIFLREISPPPPHHRCHSLKPRQWSSNIVKSHGTVGVLQHASECDQKMRWGGNYLLQGTPTFTVLSRASPVTTTT